MGINSILNFFKIPDDYDDEYEEEYAEEPVRTKPSRSVSEDREFEDTPKQRSGFLGSKPKVVPMNNRAMMEVSIIKPNTFEDSQNICNMLLAGRPVVVNLEGFDPDDAQRRF